MRRDESMRKGRQGGFIWGRGVGDAWGEIERLNESIDERT